MGTLKQGEMQGTAGAIQVLHGLLYFLVTAQIKQ
jgi:hypothetical protein